MVFSFNKWLVSEFCKIIRIRPDPQHPAFKPYQLIMFGIRIDLNRDPDPAFQVNIDPDLDPSFFMTKMNDIFVLEKNEIYFTVCNGFQVID